MTSAEANKSINEDIAMLLQDFGPGGVRTLSSAEIARTVAQRLLRMHLTTLLAVTCLILTTIVTPIDVTLLSVECTVTFVIIYGIVTSLEAFHLWARSVELRRRIMWALKEVHEAGGFTGGFSGVKGLLQAHSFRLKPVVRDGRVMHLPKALTVAADEAVALTCNPAGGVMTAMRHPVVARGCRSVIGAAMRKTLLSVPIHLPLLSAAAVRAQYPTTVASPARDAAPEIPRDPDTTDESDGATHARMHSLPAAPSSVTEQMEFFVYRSLGLVWVVLLPLLAVIGLFYAGNGDDPFLFERLLLQPVIALLGLMPFNAMIVSRAWSLWSNLVLSSRLRYMLRRADDDSSDDEAADDDAVEEGKHDRLQVLRRLRQMLKLDGSAPNLCFARNPVHALGTATSVACLDGEGSLTEMVPVPQRVLVIKALEDDADAMEGARADTEDLSYLPPAMQKMLADQIAERRSTEAAQRLDDQRFHQLELHATSSGECPIEYTDERKRARAAGGSLNPLALCALLHSVHSTSTIRGRSLPRRRDCVIAQSLDMTVLWGRCLHWFARVNELNDAVATRFRLVRRVLIMDRQQMELGAASSAYSRIVPQRCGLIFEAPNGELHVFTIGTAPLVLDGCSSTWDGEGVGSLSPVDQAKIKAMIGRWPKLSTNVGCSIRVLPERYRPFVVPPESQSPHGPRKEKWNMAEDWFLDGELIHTTHPIEMLEPLPEAAVHRRTNSADFGASVRAADEPQRPSTPQPRRTGSSETPTLSSRTASPVDELLTPSNALELAMRGQTFLGVIGLLDFIRPRVYRSIATLTNAGVRFVKFSHGSMPEARSFGARIGLKEELNNCITLQEGDQSVDSATLRAHMPMGVHSVRRHLITTDRVPLQVSMFCGARSARSRSMISVMQDNYEVVCAMGSAYNHSNLRSMLQADVALSLTPSAKHTMALEEEDFINRPLDESFFRPDATAAENLERLSDLTSSVCALRLTTATKSLPMTSALIRQARLLLKQMAQCTEFVVQCNIAISLLHVLTLLITGGPLLLAPGVTLWTLNVVVPLLGLGVAYPPKDVDIMTRMPSRHNFTLRVEAFLQWSLWFALRFVPDVLLLLGVGVWSMSSMRGVSPSQVLFRRSGLQEVTSSVEAAQLVTTLAFGYVAFWRSLTFLSRHRWVPLWVREADRDGVRSAAQSYRWLACAAGSSVLLFVACCIAYDASAWRQASANTSPVCLAMVLAYPAVMMAADRPIKRMRLKRYDYTQQMLRLTFNTRLGMHSPVGDDEDLNADATAANEEDKTSVVWQMARAWLSMDNGSLEERSARVE